MSTAEARLERARQLIEAIAASGTCADYIDVQNTARGRGLDGAVNHLLAQKSVRVEIDAICKQAREKKRGTA